MASVAITEPTKEDIDLENGSAKRYRDEAEEENGVAAKKQKSVEEVRMEGGEEEAVKEEGKAEEGEVKVGPKTFGSSVEMFDYFYKLLHNWPTNISFNKYEHLVLLELINKGHPEPEKKVGSGIIAFEIRQHPEWKSRCFFVLRADESVEDFSFRKCVDHILPLPENMKIKSDVNKALGGGGKGGGRGRGRGRGRGWGRGGGGGKFRR